MTIIKHGHNRTPEYKAWADMLQRCYNPKRSDYSRYGGRGVMVCARWRVAFMNFYLDMGPRPAGRSLERIDNNAGYRPDNCKWGTKDEQWHNRRDVLLTWPAVRDIRSSTDSVKVLAARYGVSPSSVRYVLRGQTWKETMLDNSNRLLKETA